MKHRGVGLNIHFIAGLPRSGSTLLAAILRQNPRFIAGVQSSLHASVAALMHSMSVQTDSALFLTDGQRRRAISALFAAFYDEANHAVIFDSNRGWPALIGQIGDLFPRARILCCLRNPAWILDSIEVQVQRNMWQASRMFGTQVGGNVYTRVEQLANTHLLGPSLRIMRQAWFGNDAHRMVAVRYESLSERPRETVDAIYRLIGEEPFEHDFESVSYDVPEYDRWLGMPGFHSVRPRVQPCTRTTILPPDIFSAYDECFWELPGQNPKGIVII